MGSGAHIDSDGSGGAGGKGWVLAKVAAPWTTPEVVRNTWVLDPCQQRGL